MPETKTVSLRVPVDDLAAVERAGLRPSEIMREALARKARELRASQWGEAARRRLRPAPKGFPASEDFLRSDRDRR